MKERYISKVIKVGNLSLGGYNPVRVQSMTNTNTLDVQSTINQVIRLFNAGCEIVRITAPGVREAQCLADIKHRLQVQGYNIPLVADIHFNPRAAEIAASIVDKVRINPGNYTGSKAASKSDYSDKEYDEELFTITERLKPLIEICRVHETAIRIGVNQGSLGGRILQRYGDTVEGIVNSALEYARIFNNMDFQNLIISVKSSNTRIMVEAYRELALRLDQEKLNYPLHVGVTEAGDGDEGRMKSIVGIGAVLAHGIGDTIRVSLTEDPEKEIPVALSIVNHFNKQLNTDIFTRDFQSNLLLGNNKIDRTILDSKILGFPEPKSPTALVIKKGNKLFLATEDLSINSLPHRLVDINSFLQTDDYDQKLIFVEQSPFNESMGRLIIVLANAPHIPLLIKLYPGDALRFITDIRTSGIINPIILMSPFMQNNHEEMLNQISLFPGSLLVESYGEGLCLEQDNIPLDQLIKNGFGILQASRARITRTEFISCPSCGRTQFDLMHRLQEVKAATSHLKGLKIAVMGCIVNGPGEMADADYGYVGAENGKVTLYKAKTPIKHSVPESEAVQVLVELIKENGDWRLPA